MASQSNQMGASGYESAAKNLVPMIQALQKAGKLDEVMQQALGESAPKPVPLTTHGAMTDGSKRRLTSSPPSDVDSEVWELAGMVPPDGPPDWTEMMAQQPVPPPKLNLLPPGFPTVAEWGRTVLELPKVVTLMGSKDVSYAEMVKAAQTDGAVHQYLVWCHNHPEVSARVKDFSNYLKMIRFDLEKDNKPKMYFAGSSEVRRLK